MLNTYCIRALLLLNFNSLKVIIIFKCSICSFFFFFFSKLFSTEVWYLFFFFYLFIQSHNYIFSIIGLNIRIRQRIIIYYGTLRGGLWYYVVTCGRPNAGRRVTEPE